MARADAKSLVMAANLAGFSPNRKTNNIGHDIWAAAIALAESGGDLKAHNSTPPDNSYGVMQINMIGSMGAARRKQFGISKNEELYDLQTNMDAAYKIYKAAGYSFRPWSTYPTKASLKIPQVIKALKSSDPKKDYDLSDRQFFYKGRADIRKTMKNLGEGLGEFGEAIPDALGEAAELGVGSLEGLDPFGLRSLTEWLEGKALRIGAFVGGGLLLVIALLMLMGKSSTVGGAVKTMAKGVKGGA